MSRADEFRKSTEEFWSEMDKKRKVVAADHKTPTKRSGDTAKKRAPKPKKKVKR